MVFLLQGILGFLEILAALIIAVGEASGCRCFSQPVLFLDTVHMGTRPVLGVMSSPQVAIFMAVFGSIPIEHASGVPLFLLRRIFLVRHTPV